MIAVIATFEGLPAAFIRSYCALISGLYRVATMAGKYSASRRGFRPPWMKDFPRHLPDCLVIGAMPASEATAFFLRLPISGISIRIVVAATTPIPLMLWIRRRARLRLGQASNCARIAWSSSAMSATTWRNLAQPGATWRNLAQPAACQLSRQPLLLPIQLVLEAYFVFHQCGAGSL